MKALDLKVKAERKLALRQAILRRAPGIAPELVDCICEAVNINHCYFIKSTADKQKFLNLATRETIATKEIRAFSEVIPIFGNYKSPYFEKIGDNRFIRKGELDASRPAAAVKIRIGTENQRTSITYSLILYSAESNHFSTAS